MRPLLELGGFLGDRDANEEDAEHGDGGVALPVLRAAVGAAGHAPHLGPEILSMVCVISSAAHGCKLSLSLSHSSMDAIPTTSISTLRKTSSFLPSSPPPLLLKPNPNYLYRSRSHKSTRPPPPPPPPPSSIRTLKPPSLLVSSSSFSPPPISSSSSSKQHHKASTGYAAALLDVSRCQNSIHAVYNDVHKLMHVLHDTESMKKALKSGGGFAKPLVVLVKMLVKRGKSGLVLEVMDEFIKLYDELTCTPVMLVS